MVRALSSHQCGPVQIPVLMPYVGWVCCWFSPFALRGVSLGTPVFPSPYKPALPNSNSIWNAQFTCFNEFLRTRKSSVGKQIIIFVTIIELQGCTVLAVILRHIQGWFGWSLNPWPPAQQPCAHPIYHTCKKNVQLSNKRVLFRTFEDSFSLQMSSSSQGRLHLLLSL